MKQKDESISNFENNGYFVFDLARPQTIYDVQEQLENQLKKITENPIITLDNYHSYFQDNDAHFDIQVKLTQFFREKRFAHNVITENASVFKEIIGPDVDLQESPYLRIARPKKQGDNIGFHRDTFYGACPFELSIFIPFVNITAEKSLSMYPGSHKLPESHFPTTQIESNEVTGNDKALYKGSPKHDAGFLYSPKVMDPSVKQHMIPVPLKAGQAMCFMLSIVHGSEINNSDTPRWSSDIRVKHPLAVTNTKPGYYQPFLRSAILNSYNQYLEETKEVNSV